MCGSKIKTNEDLVEFLIDVINQNDKYKERRRECKEMFNVFSTQLGCEIILKAIGLKESEEKL